MCAATALPNYINGNWCSAPDDCLPIINPATLDLLGHVPLSTAADVDQAVQAAQAAFPGWRQTPPGDRIRYLFHLRQALEEHREAIATIITQECGKTLAESRGELQRAIENVEVACGIPTLMQGYNSEDIARGIDETLIRQPLGVTAIIAPFNFPGMIPFWFLPYAIACGNTCVIKPSEKVPLTMQAIMTLIHQLDLPPGVVNLVNGAKETVDALLDHPQVRAISFVGSSAVARYVYSRAAANGKRAQCQGGAKNPVIVLPDADLDMTTRIMADSAFGCAGQRCLAASLAITVGEAKQSFTDAIATAAEGRRVGYGLEDGVQMGTVISADSKARIEALIQTGVEEGAKPLVDGRQPHIPGYEQGHFVRPTILDGVDPDSCVAQTEIFGPVLGLIHVDTIEAAIALVNRGRYGNMACLFTSSGAAARQFRYAAEAGNIGINIGVAAPMAFFPFSGWKDSFFGDLHGQGHHAVEFFTQTKVVIERWPQHWSRQF
jgi:malonate-semialdehyde dehydrogenase (acetylating)/methylmalonate-semialdehyde dehydrogenase